jgi:hypothetical protein
MVARQVLNHLSHTHPPQSFFVLVVFLVGCFFCLGPASDHDPLIYASHVVGVTGMSHCA